MQSELVYTSIVAQIVDFVNIVYAYFLKLQEYIVI